LVRFCLPQQFVEFVIGLLDWNFHSKLPFSLAWLNSCFMSMILIYSDSHYILKCLSFFSSLFK
jgi:hypothetical protein